MGDGTIWREIRDAISADIQAGRYRPGEKLPTEAALSTRFAVNRHTIRRALSSLHEEGLTRARRGSGVFVATQPTVYPIGKRVRFHASLEASGQTPSKEIIRLETIAATEREATALDLSVGDPVHVWEGTGQADGLPVTLFRSWFPATRLPGLPQGLAAHRSVTAALADEGVGDYTRLSTEVTSERASPLQARHLHLADGAPLLCTRSINIDTDGRPVELGLTWFAGERVRLVFNENVA